MQPFLKPLAPGGSEVLAQATLPLRYTLAALRIALVLVLALAYIVIVRLALLIFVRSDDFTAVTAGAHKSLPVPDTTALRLFSTS